MDRLQQMMDSKDEINPIFGSPTLAEAREMPLQQRLEIVNRHFFHLVKEIAELGNECKTDFWKKNTAPDAAKIAEEYSDCLHVLLSIGVILGLSSQDIFDAFMAKHNKNLARLDWKGR